MALANPPVFAPRERERLFPECPFCEAHPVSMTAHVRDFHKDRIIATVAYQQVIASGGTEAEAQTRYNTTLRSMATPGPGRYDRVERGLTRSLERHDRQAARA
jgi:hypothetical protein